MALAIARELDQIGVGNPALRHCGDGFARAVAVQICHGGQMIWIGGNTVGTEHDAVGQTQTVEAGEGIGRGAVGRGGIVQDTVVVHECRGRMTGLGSTGNTGSLRRHAGAACALLHRSHQQTLAVSGHNVIRLVGARRDTGYRRRDRLQRLRLHRQSTGEITRRNIGNAARSISARLVGERDFSITHGRRRAGVGDRLQQHFSVAAAIVAVGE